MAGKLPEADLPMTTKINETGLQGVCLQVIDGVAGHHQNSKSEFMENPN
jgi:hypothetical protein